MAPVHVFRLFPIPIVIADERLSSLRIRTFVQNLSVRQNRATFGRLDADGFKLGTLHEPLSELFQGFQRYIHTACVQDIPCHRQKMLRNTGQIDFKSALSIVDIVVLHIVVKFLRHQEIQMQAATGRGVFHMGGRKEFQDFRRSIRQRTIIRNTLVNVNTSDVPGNVDADTVVGTALESGKRGFQISECSRIVYSRFKSALGIVRDFGHSSADLLHLPYTERQRTHSFRQVPQRIRIAELPGRAGSIGHMGDMSVPHIYLSFSGIVAGRKISCLYQ